jgi:hypothetical protein
MKILLFILLCAMFLTQAQDNSTGTLANSVIIFVNGDGDYNVSDGKGKYINLDEDILFKSVKASEKINNSEAFIFHYKKRETSFIFFKGNDLDMYYYKYGSLVQKTSIPRKTFNFKEEIDFYKKYHASSIKNLMLYYGHEIPLTGGRNYYSSYKDELFNLSVFSTAVKNFYPGKKADLIVLSSDCSGIPIVVSELSSLAEYIVAPPDELGSKFINPFNIKKLNRHKAENFEDFVVEFTSASFREIRNNNPSLSVLSAYKTSDLSGKYLQAAIKKTSIISEITSDYEQSDLLDCTGEISGSSKGVIVFYNPPLSGSRMAKFEHSGWGCKKLKDSAFLDARSNVNLTFIHGN